DLFHGEIVAYSTGTSQDMALVYRALTKLKHRGGYKKRALIHSDQGIQFTNAGYQKRLADMTLTPSMSRRGNCWDNACIENFFSHLKSEMQIFGEPKTLEDVQAAVDAYIEYYNHKRIQTKLKMSPVAFRTSKAA
ncbi:IS3 family transposase, partial [Aureibacillus halotolerans]